MARKNGNKNLSETETDESSVAEDEEETDDDEMEASDDDEDTDEIDASPAELKRPDDYLPEGFEQLGAEQAPFLIKKAGLIVTGTLIDRFLRKGKQAAGPNRMGSPYYYQIRVDRRVRGVLGSKKEKTQKKVWVEPGEVISIDEMESMKDFAAITKSAGDDNTYGVFIRFLRKRELASGNSFWELKKGYRILQKGASGGRITSPNARGLGEVA